MANFLNDTFTDTGGTLLESHVGEVGALWTKHPNSASGSMIITTSPTNRARANAAGISVYYSSGVPSSADYTGTVNFVWQTGITTGIVFRCSTTANTYYLVWWDSATVSFKLFSNVAGSFSTLGTAAFAAPAAGTPVSISFSAVGTAISITGAVTISATDSSITAAGRVGLVTSGTATDSTGIHFDSISATDSGGGALAPGAISIGAVTNATINATATAATGGAGGYTRQWYASATSGFTPGVGNALAGQTALTLALTSALYPSLTPGVPVNLKVIYTDSASATATSKQAAAMLGDTPFKLGAIGDSVTLGSGLSAGQDPVTQCGVFLASLGKVRTVTTTNRGISGTRTSDWLPAGANLPAAVTAMLAAGVTHCLVTLGINDSIAPLSGATYEANLVSICNNLTSNGITPILNYPTYTWPDGSDAVITEATVALLEGYLPHVDAAIAAGAGLRGDTAAFAFFADLPPSSYLQSDKVHPSAAGAQLLGRAWARAVDRAVLAPAGGTTVVGVKRLSFGGGF